MCFMKIAFYVNHIKINLQINALKHNGYAVDMQYRIACSVIKAEGVRKSRRKKLKKRPRKFKKLAKEIIFNAFRTKFGNSPYFFGNSPHFFRISPHFKINQF